MLGMCTDGNQRWLDWWCSHIFSLLPISSRQQNSGASLLPGGEPRVLTGRNMPHRKACHWRTYVTCPVREKSAFEDHENIKTRLFSPKLRREAAEITTTCPLPGSTQRAVTGAQREAAVRCPWKDWILSTKVSGPSQVFLSHRWHRHSSRVMQLPGTIGVWPMLFLSCACGVGWMCYSLAL